MTDVVGMAEEDPVMVNDVRDVAIPLPLEVGETTEVSVAVPEDWPVTTLVGGLRIDVAPLPFCV
jgi:hypothetical protein